MPNPRAIPENTRPMNNTVRLPEPSAKSALPSIAMIGAGIISARRPCRSDNGPPINRAGTIPSTYAARSISTETWSNPSTWRYMTSSGVNSLPPHATANNPAATRVQGLMFTVRFLDPADALRYKLHGKCRCEDHQFTGPAPRGPGPFNHAWPIQARRCTDCGIK